jgi:hypothetical protein
MKSSCYFVFNRSALLYPNQYSTNLHNSLGTCSILVFVLSSAALHSLSLYDWNLLVWILNWLVLPNVFKISPWYLTHPENPLHVTALTSPLVCGWDPKKKQVMWQLPTVVVMSLHLRRSVFTEQLLRNRLRNPIILLLPLNRMCCRHYLAMDLHVTTSKTCLLLWYVWCVIQYWG